MIVVFVGAISVILMGYVLYPLLQENDRLRYIPEGMIPFRLIKLNQKKNELLATLKELEFEHQMGKISLSDYNQLKQKYELETVQIFKDIKKNGGDSGKRAEIEEKIRAYRQKLKKSKIEPNNLRKNPK
ncbi:MAG: hypothetical protein GXO76_10135 [Calditrichaeota bacterium]|nr:hypothetical protein [Calditrichota bacterium]